MNTSTGWSYDLRNQREVTLESSGQEALDLKMTVGTQAFVGQQADEAESYGV